MKKLITYIFFLSILISLMYVTKEIINFSKNVILLNGSQTEAVIKQERMLFPVVKITNIEQGFVYDLSDSGDFELQAAVSTATGFSIKYDPVADVSFLITNDHFCNSINLGSLLIIEDYENKTIDAAQEFVGSRILYTDPKLDLCLLKSPGFIAPTIIADHEYSPKLFEKVFIVGGPSGDFPIIIDTYISSYMQRGGVGLPGLSKDGNDFMLISEQIFPGHSGSPVFNQSGEVIGVIFGALQSYGGIAVTHKDIFELLFRYQNDI